MNDGTIKSIFNEGHMKVEGETAYCVDINNGFKNGYKTRHDASASMSAAQIEDVALSLEYMKQYVGSHSNLSTNQAYLLEQCLVWQRLSEHLGWQCDNVRVVYSEISQDIQNEVYDGAKSFVKANKGRYKCGGYIYTGEGQDIGQFWAELNVGNAKVKKTTANESVTNGNAMYSIAGATFGIFSDQNCSNQIGTLTTNENGDTNEVEVTAGTVYIKELSAPKGYKLDTTVRSLKVEAGKTVTLNVSDVPKVTETLVDLFKIDMETGKATAQGNAALAGAEFTWHYYDGLYTKDNLPEKATRTWVTKTVAEKSSDGSIHYVTKLSDAYKVSGDAFYTQNEKSVLPLGTLAVEETKAPDGYLLDGAYMQAGDSTEQIKGNMIKPYLKYKEEASGETWIENAFSKENVEEIMQGVEGVVNDPEGTGYAAHRDDILLAGKTGTAELKATKEDTSGKEIGWFSVFTADKSVDKPILLISMVENVKGIGGSGYVVKKDATVLEEYFEK